MTMKPTLTIGGLSLMLAVAPNLIAQEPAGNTSANTGLLVGLTALAERLPGRPTRIEWESTTQHKSNK